MHSPLSVPAGRSVDLWLNGLGVLQRDTQPAAPLPDPDTAGSPETVAEPGINAAAVSELAQERPDLAEALQRLAGIDPTERQQHYEELRRQILRLNQNEIDLSDVSEDGGGGQAGYQPDASEENPEPPNLKPLSPEAVVLRAYLDASRPSAPISLLALPSA